MVAPRWAAEPVFKIDTSNHEPGAPRLHGGRKRRRKSRSRSDPLLDAAGNLYGTTLGGGSGGQGIVFKIDITNHETVLYTFTGGNDGGGPAAGSIRDAAGNLYGTTAGGGSSGQGAVFKIDTTNHETVLYSFTGGSDGGSPLARTWSGMSPETSMARHPARRDPVALRWACGTHLQDRPIPIMKTTIYSFTGGRRRSKFHGRPARLDATGNLYGTAYQERGICNRARAAAPCLSFRWTTTSNFAVLNGNNTTSTAIRQ